MDIKKEEGSTYTSMSAPEVLVTYQGHEHSILQVTAEVFGLTEGQELYPEVPLHEVLDHDANVYSAIQDRLSRYDLPDALLH